MHTPTYILCVGVGDGGELEKKNMKNSRADVAPSENPKEVTGKC